MKSLVGQSVTRAEVLGALSHALDITEGQPEGHCVRACWVGMHIGRALDLSETELGELFYAILLKDAGCSSNAARICQLYLADDIGLKRDFKTVDSSVTSVLKFVLGHTGLRAGLMDRFQALGNLFVNGGTLVNELIETRCQRGAEIARQLRFPETVAEAVHGLDELWDGSGHPDGLAGRKIPLYSRIALLSQVVDVFVTCEGPEAATAEVCKRSGSWFDPEVVEAFCYVAEAPEFWDGLCSEDIHALVFALEPEPSRIDLDDGYLDDIAAAFGQVVDAKSPYTSGHSTRVAFYADLIGVRMGLSEVDRRWLHRGALLHDIGKLGVSNAILDKPARLEGDEWIEMQGHAARTASILSKISVFEELADVAAAHHERLDGKGYPLQLKGNEISFLTRIISVADFFDALTADRPYRKAMPLEKALAIMGNEVGSAIDERVFAALEDVLKAEDVTADAERLSA